MWLEFWIQYPSGKGKFSHKLQLSDDCWQKCHHILFFFLYFPKFGNWNDNFLNLILLVQWWYVGRGKRTSYKNIYDISYGLLKWQLGWKATFVAVYQSYYQVWKGEAVIFIFFEDDGGFCSNPPFIDRIFVLIGKQKYIIRA